METALRANYKEFQVKVKATCEVPDAKIFVELLKKILDSKKILIFHDIPFRATGLAGARFFVFGNRKGSVFQYEIASNICGGPYSMMSCGMG